MSILRTLNEITADELESIGAAIINSKKQNLSKFNVQRILDREVRFGFVSKTHGREYTFFDRHEIDGTRKRAAKPKTKEMVKSAKTFVIEPLLVKSVHGNGRGRRKRAIKPKTKEMVRSAKTFISDPLSSDDSDDKSQIENAEYAARVARVEYRGDKRALIPNPTVVAAPDTRNRRKIKHARGRKIDLDLDEE